jgi:hypothetical protein
LVEIAVGELGVFAMGPQDSHAYEVFRLIRPLLRIRLHRELESAQLPTSYEPSLPGILTEYLARWDQTFSSTVPGETKALLESLRSLHATWQEGELSQRGAVEVMDVAFELLTALGLGSTAGQVRDLRIEVAGTPPQSEDLHSEVEELPPPEIPEELEAGNLYTRKEISQLLGGSMQEYLPHVNYQVIAGAFTTTANPEAPDAIFVPNRPYVIKWARIAAGQSFRIPIFLKRTISGWEYVGNYRAVALLEEESAVLRYRRKHPHLDIAMVLCFELSP